MGAPIEQGTILAGKYQVDRVLGEGGMGVVVAATDTQLERRVAIKFLLPEYAEHHEAAQRFMREARAAVKIQSEHIARVIDVNRMDNGSPYMVMEYLQGGDLSDVLQARGPLPSDEAVLYVLQACEAIAEAHSYGIVHRDLKPANLFLAQQPDGTSKIKVLDFGISKMTLGGSTGIDASLTRTTSMMGSPLYMSPEQMRSTRDVDARTDIWALGVILYELLAASLPFNGESIPVLSAKILLEAPDPLRTKRPDIPAALEQIVMRTLMKDPRERFPTISELAIALLPYAPRRARQNVERITKVLGAAGLSSSQYTGSMHPPHAGASLQATTGDVVRALNGGAAQGVTSDLEGAATQIEATQANFGQTTGLPKRSSHLGILLAVAAVVLLLAGGGVAALLLKGSEQPVATQNAMTAEPAKAAAAAEPKAEPVTPKAEPEPEPSPEPTPEPEPKSEPEPAPEAEAKPTAAAVQPKPAPRPAPAPRKTSKTSKTTSTTTKPAATSAKTASPETSGGFRSRFGSRK